MEREHNEDIIELGVASIETKGAVGRLTDEALEQPIGLSDD